MKEELKENFILEVKQLLDRYKIAATTQISEQLLTGITEVPKDIQETMLLIAKIDSFLSGQSIPIQRDTESVDTQKKTTFVTPPVTEYDREHPTEDVVALEPEPKPDPEPDLKPEEDDYELPPYVIEEQKTIPVVSSEENEPILEQEDAAEMETSENNDSNDETSTEDTPVRQGATIIGATPMDVPAPIEMPFIEELSKPASSFVFDKYKIMASHFGVPGASDIELYIAPLVIAKHAPNIPIIVHAYCAGQFKTVSSYDVLGDGKNMVTFDIGDFCLLCRGNFDDDGRFISHVLTTGISSNQGDQLDFVKKVSGAQTFVQGNGHLKFKDDNNTTYEIFPLDTDPKEKAEYICIKNSAEFLDYFVVANGYGTPQIRIPELGQEIVVGWMGSIFEAEII